LGKQKIEDIEFKKGEHKNWLSQYYE
jgi:hypothetical protein